MTRELNYSLGLILNVNSSIELSEIHNRKVLILNRLPIGYGLRLQLPSSEAYLSGSAHLKFLFQLGNNLVTTF